MSERAREVAASRAGQVVPKVRPARLRLVPAVLGLGVALALAGCGSGQVTQTSSQVAAVNGASGEIGDIAVRNAQLAFPETAERYYPAGSNAPVLVTIVNTGDTPDRLVSVATDAASSVQLQGDTNLPGNRTLTSWPAESLRTDPHGTATPSSAAHPSESSAHPTSSPGAPSVTSSPSAEPGSGTTTSSGSPSSAAVEKIGYLTIVLTGLTKDVRPGQTVKVTFLFVNAGPLTLELPIAAPKEPRHSEHGEH